MFCQAAQPLQTLTRFGYNRLLHFFTARTALNTRPTRTPKAYQAQHRLQSGITGGQPPLQRFAATAAAPLLGSTHLTSSRQHRHRCRAVAATSMEVTRHNFDEVLPAVRAALADCHFFALDCEMTGLHVRDQRFSFHADMQDQYTTMVESAQSFQLTQVGLSAFQWEEARSQYVARTFNFWIFPRPADGFDARFLSQAGSMEFLASQGFDFNKWVHEGIGYLPAASRDVRLAAARARREGAAVAGDGAVREAIALVKQPDIDFTARLASDVDAWLQGTEETLQLESVNGYYRRLQYQYLGSRGSPGAAGFVVERLADGRQATLQLRRQTAQQAAEWQEAQLQQKEAEIHAAAGFTAVLQAMRDSGAPAVGHNLALDLAYILQAFAGPLPPAWRDYKALAAAWFPGGIYDTKRLAAQLPQVFGGQTSLGEVYDVVSGRQVEARMVERQEPVCLAAAGIPPETLPRVQHADGFLRYQGDEAASFAHEAGYDAYMTAVAFSALLRLLQLQSEADANGSQAMATDTQHQPSLEAAQEFVGQLNLVRTDIPYAALAGEDPQLERPHVFHVAGLPPGSRHSDISTAFALAGIGRIQSVMLDAAGTTAAVAVQDTEALDRVVAALADWGPQVTPFAEWSRSRRAGGDADMMEGQAATAAPGVARFAAAARGRPGDGHAPIKRRRLSAVGNAAAEPLPRPQRTSCVLQ